MPNEIGHQRGPTLPFGIRIEPNKLMYRAPRAAQVVGRDIKPKLCKSKTVSCLCAYAKCLTLNWLTLWPLSPLTYELTSIAIVPDSRYPCGRCRRRGRARRLFQLYNCSSMVSRIGASWLLSLSFSSSLFLTHSCQHMCVGVNYLDKQPVTGVELPQLLPSFGQSLRLGLCRIIC